MSQLSDFCNSNGFAISVVDSICVPNFIWLRRREVRNRLFLPRIWQRGKYIGKGANKGWKLCAWLARFAQVARLRRAGRGERDACARLVVYMCIYICLYIFSFVSILCLGYTGRRDMYGTRVETYLVLEVNAYNQLMMNWLCKWGHGKDYALRSLGLAYTSSRY